jgi:exopolyphosphatase/guanosine-5'-triphosphate,3'-diphosphate pyrophosphatase
VLGHRGGLKKIGALPQAKWAKVLALRLAVICCRSRTDRPLPPLQLEALRNGFSVGAPDGWLDENPLTHMALLQEATEWREANMTLQLSTNFQHWN